MTVDPTWQLALALGLLLALTVGVSWWAGLGTTKDSIIATVRAIVQLTVVSFVIVGAIAHLATAFAFVLLMFAVAVYTTSKRTGVLKRWWWPAVAVAAGVLPVSAIVFASGVMPLAGIAIIPVMGIVIGNMMTAHTLAARRMFAALREDRPTYEGVLALGLKPSVAVRVITSPLRREALIPNLDQTRTVGLVTLPGAFIGVLLGGGSPLQAAAAQVLVLIMIMAGQNIVVMVTELLMRAGKDLPDDLAEATGI